MNYKEIKKDNEQIKLNNESKERNRRCRYGVCSRPVSPSSYWYCGSHNKLRGVSDDTLVYSIQEELQWEHY